MENESILLQKCHTVPLLVPLGVVGKTALFLYVFLSDHDCGYSRALLLLPAHYIYILFAWGIFPCWILYVGVREIKGMNLHLYKDFFLFRTIPQMRNRVKLPRKNLSHHDYFK